MPAGAKAKVSQNPGGSYAVENLGGGTVTATVDGVQTTIAAGQARSLTALDFQGFTSPVDNPDVLNVVNAGQAVPFEVVAGAPGRLAPHDVVHRLGVGCTLASLQARRPTRSRRSHREPRNLQNLGNGYYQLNWKSPRLCQLVQGDPPRSR